jgi:hypothetical protein
MRGGLVARFGTEVHTGGHPDVLGVAFRWSCRPARWLDLCGNAGDSEPICWGAGVGDEPKGESGSVDGILHARARSTGRSRAPPPGRRRCAAAILAASVTGASCHHRSRGPRHSRSLASRSNGSAYRCDLGGAAGRRRGNPAYETKSVAPIHRLAMGRRTGAYVSRRSHAKSPRGTLGKQAD